MPSLVDEIYSQPLINGPVDNSRNFTITINGKKLSGEDNQPVSIISLTPADGSSNGSLSGKSSVRSASESAGKSILTRWFSSRVRKNHQIIVGSQQQQADSLSPTVIRIDSIQSSPSVPIETTNVSSTATVPTDSTDNHQATAAVEEVLEEPTVAQIPSYDSVLRSDAQRFIDQQFRVPAPLPPPMFHMPMAFHPHLIPPTPVRPPVGILRRTNAGANPRRVRQANITQCATSPNVELTRWNFAGEFDTQQHPIVPNTSNNRENSRRPREVRRNDHILLPENLAPLMHGWGLPPPFLLADSQVEPEPKGCCGRPTSHTTMIRWFIGVISVIGLGCVIVGIVLGALTVSGSTRLTLCLLMIGVGVVLIIVSAVAWRLTALDHSSTPSCWSIFGCRSSTIASVFPDRRTNTCRNGRGGLPTGLFPPMNFLLPDFPWRPPPPSYQSAVQEHRVQQFLNTRHNRTAIGSPPPTYRCTRPPELPCRIQVDQLPDALSGPPSYRSHMSPTTPTHRSLTAQTALSRGVESSIETAHNAAIAATEVVAISDESDLLSSVGHLSDPDDHLSTPIYQEIDQIASGTVVEVHQPTAKISVVDCSQVIPVGFEIENCATPSVHSRSNSTLSSSSTTPEVERHHNNRSTPSRKLSKTGKPLRFRAKSDVEETVTGAKLKSYRIANYANSGFTDGLNNNGAEDHTLVSRIVIQEPIFSPRPNSHKGISHPAPVQTVAFHPDPTEASTSWLV